MQIDELVIMFFDLIGLSRGVIVTCGFVKHFFIYKAIERGSNSIYN